MKGNALFASLVRRISRWAWEETLGELMEQAQEATSARREAQLLQLNQETLIDLFREKQGKITRLQANYAESSRPLREDLRRERPMGNLRDHLTLLAQAPARHEQMRRRGFPGKPSDGTVEGVPFDEPNEPVPRAWGARSAEG